MRSHPSLVFLNFKIFTFVNTNFYLYGFRFIVLNDKMTRLVYSNCSVDLLFDLECEFDGLEQANDVVQRVFLISHLFFVLWSI